jgi:hypothetical protein
VTAPANGFEIAGILALAEEEARRRRHRQVGALHVAHVLGTLFPQDLERHFGVFGRMLLDDLLNGRRVWNRGNAARAASILESATSADDALSKLREYLALPELFTDRVERAAHERWLVAAIDDRFRAYRIQPTQPLLDELYILVAVLRVLGLPSAHEATKARLRALPRS